jgi:hypothetical protein
MKRTARQQRPPVRLTRRGRRVVAGGMTGVVLTGAGLLADGLRGSAGPPQPAAAVTAAEPVPSAAKPSGKPSPRQAAAVVRPLMPPAVPVPGPVRIRIRSIGVDAPLTNVGLDKNGWVQAPPPADKNLAAWYRGSAVPGALGTSVIVGHVDNKAGPAVFYGLGALKKGNALEVRRRDGTTAVFTVYGVQVFAKDAFPAQRVYGATGRAELRVITCGGVYTKARGYSGNVVVFARLVNGE